MKVAKAIALLGMVFMIGAFIYGFAAGDILGDASSVLGVPWGQVAMVDLSIGLILFDAWIIYREPRRWSTLIWVILLSTVGFFIASLYVFTRLEQSGGSWQRFWMGKHSPA
jgi:drug/metabolite transporter (DMT)-like permease